MAIALEPLREQSAEGARVLTSDGRELVNCGGYGTLTLGARHPAVVAAVTEQLGRLPVGSRALPDAYEQGACAALASTVPAALGEVAFAVTGSEAVELALRLTRLNRCTRLVAFGGGFHGRTLGALSVNGSVRLRRLYEPLLDGVEIVDYDDVAALERSLAGSAARTAVIVEPVQGEAGVVIPADGFLAEVARLCRAHGAMLVVDEVQTGLGRLGCWWGIEREGVVPDVLVVGKALGGGVLPVSAIVATAEAFRPFRLDPRQAASTFSGYPLGAAAVTATIATMRREGIVEAARRTGAAVARLLASATAGADAGIRDVRGIGLLHAVEFERPQFATAFVRGLLEAGVLCSSSTGASTTVRLTPPAKLPDDALEVLARALEHGVLRAGAEVARLRRRSTGAVAGAVAS